MTKLSEELSSPPSHRSSISSIHSALPSADGSAANGLLESNPVYVTSVPNLTTSQTSVKTSPNSHKSQQKSSPKSQHQVNTSPKGQASLSRSSKRSSQGHSRSRSRSKGTPESLDFDPNKSGDELELTHEIEDCPETRKPERSNGDLDSSKRSVKSGEVSDGSHTRSGENLSQGGHPSRSQEEEYFDSKETHSRESQPRDPQSRESQSRESQSRESYRESHSRESHRESQSRESPKRDVGTSGTPKRLSRGVLGEDINTSSPVISDEEEDEEFEESGDDSHPATPERCPGSVQQEYIEGPARSEVANQRTEVLLDRPFKHADGESSRKSGSSTGGGNVRGNGTAAHTGDKFSPTTEDPDSMMELGEMNTVVFDPTTKEMAVDVPDTFVGRTKTPPRYPPPRPQQRGGPLSPVHNNNNNSTKKGTTTTTPLNGTLSKPVQPPKVPDIYRPQQPQQVVVQSPSTQEEMDRLRRYEDEIKTRRERDEAMTELSRTSIRGSQKLQALVSQPIPLSQPSPTGVVNDAYDENEMTSPERVKDPPSINELINSLQNIQTVLQSNGHRISEDVDLVAQLLTNAEFQKVLAVHNKVQETMCLNTPPTPINQEARQIVTECLEALHLDPNPDAVELSNLLNKHAMEGLFYAHDRIAHREPPMEIPSMDSPTSSSNVDEHNTSGATNHSQAPSDSGNLSSRLDHQEGLSTASTQYEANVQIVRIDKTNEPLGATIRNEGDLVIIGRIVRGGAAEKSGMLHEGDEILEVNGLEVRGKSVNDICDMLAGMTGTLTFMIIPCSTPHTIVPPSPLIGQTMTVKAYFDYDPEEDLYIPCRELGMSFNKGDILHVMSQADPNWWQAYRDGEQDQNLAGLIPSKAFQQHYRREAMRQTVVGDNNNKEKSKKGKLLCAKKQHKKKKKKMLYPNYNEDFDCEEIFTYEKMELYYPRANRKRPVVLIGPPNIGRHELRQKLMEDRDRFAAAVPHTSRAKRDREVDGQDYHFISRTQFEADILARKFVEHGEYEKAYYGTSLDAIRAVVNSGKICVLNLHPLSLKMLRSSELKPYVVLIAPPSLEKLKQNKIKSGQAVKEEELKDIIQRAREMEEQSGHYFDLVLINQDIERTYMQLCQEINVLERQPQYVPASWMENER